MATTFPKEFENYVANLLGPRYCWAIHTEPVRILMEKLYAAQLAAQPSNFVDEHDIRNGWH